MQPGCKKRDTKFSLSKYCGDISTAETRWPFGSSRKGCLNTLAKFWWLQSNQATSVKACQLTWHHRPSFSSWKWRAVMKMWWFIWWIHKVESWWVWRVLRDGGMRRSQWCCNNASSGERASSSFSPRKANICSRSICPKENTTLSCGLLKQLKFSLLRKRLGFSNGLPVFARISTKSGRKNKHRQWRRLRDAA